MLSKCASSTENRLLTSPSLAHSIQVQNQCNDPANAIYYADTTKGLYKTWATSTWRGKEMLRVRSFTLMRLLLGLTVFIYSQLGSYDGSLLPRMYKIADDPLTDGYMYPTECVTPFLLAKSTY
jgi:hypothetical protein